MLDLQENKAKKGICIKFIKAALLMVSAHAASASAGFYADIATGLSYSTFEVADHILEMQTLDCGRFFCIYTLMV